MAIGILIVYSVLVLGLAGMGVYLVIEGHPAWAWIPFLIAGFVEIKFK